MSKDNPTKGEKAFRINYESSNTDLPHTLKVDIARVYDRLEDYRKTPGADQRLVAVAQTELEKTSTMITKAVTSHNYN